MRKFLEGIKFYWNKFTIKPEQKPLVNRIWFDEKKGQIFIHTNCRSGIFYLPIEEGEKYSYWLADVFETEEKKLPKTETIYKLIEIRNESPLNN